MSKEGMIYKYGHGEEWRLLTTTETALMTWGLDERSAIALAKHVTLPVNPSAAQVETAVTLALVRALEQAQDRTEVQIIFAERRDTRRIQ